MNALVKFLVATMTMMMKLLKEGVRGMNTWFFEDCEFIKPVVNLDKHLISRQTLSGSLMSRTSRSWYQCSMSKMCPE